MTNNQYYYVVGDQAHGPVPADSLVAMYKSRHLSATTMICPVGSKMWMPMSDMLKKSLTTKKERDTQPLQLPTKRKKQDGSSRALNILAVFCALPCAGIILLSIFKPKAFMDLWGVAVFSILIALFWAILAKLVGGKS